MTSQHPDFDAFYDDQVEAHRHFFSRQNPNPWDRITQPSVLISCLIVVVTLSYNLYASTTTIQDSIRLLGTSLWDGFVFVVPERLLDAIDTPGTSTTTTTTSAAQPMLRAARSRHDVKSDKMRRVLGLDRSGGVMSSVLQVRSRALSLTGSVLGLKGESSCPPGLGNMDNSCYQNSILQGLSSLKPLPEYLSAYLEASDDSGDQDVAQTLRTLITDLNDGSNYGRTLWTPGVLKSMSTWTQQDAQEYYSKILDDIDKSVAKAIKSAQPQHPGFAAKIDKDDAAASEHSDDSGYQSIINSPETKLPRNPLEGMLAQRVACVQCGHSDGLSMIPFTCLTLSLGLNKNQHDLYERLDAYSKVEAIENVECTKCTLIKTQQQLSAMSKKMQDSGSAANEKLAEHLNQRLEAVELALEEDDFDDKTLTEKCKISAQNKVSSTKTKQIVISRPPKSLAIHMQRSVFDPSTFNMMKNSAPVDFPMTLDLAPWCLGSTGSNPLDEKSKLEEEWVTDPRKSMVAGDQGSSKLAGPIYELRAVVTHYGRHENGHYICYRKYPRRSPPTKTVEDDEPDDKADTKSEPIADEKEADDPEMDWWRLSDHNVSQVSEDTVLNLSPGVFMLFYDCVDPSMVMNDEDAVSMQDAVEAAGVDAANGLVSAAENPAPTVQGQET
ncbi:ubiquitin-specific protease ubp1 [Fusarium chlamydosporum]